MSDTVSKLRSRRTLWLLAGGLTTGVAGYALYRAWLRDYLESRWTSLSAAASSASKLLEALGTASELSATVVKDVQEFLSSDSDQVPRSVRQLLKLTRSPDFQQAVLLNSQHVTLGVVQALASSDALSTQSAQSKGLLDSLMDKLFTEEGKSFASAVCARMVRALVTSLQAPAPGTQQQRTAADSPSCSATSAPQEATWLEVLVHVFTTDQGKELAAMIVKTAAVNSVGTFLDKTEGVNMYTDIVSGISTNPALVKDVTSHVMVCMVREAVKQWQRGGQRRVQAEPPSGSSSSFTSSPRADIIHITTFTDSDTETRQEPSNASSSGLSREIVQCLSQPDIRQLMLDVTAVVTTRGMEAFLLVLLSRLVGGQGLPALEGESCSEPGLDVQKTQGKTALQISRKTQDGRMLASRGLAVASVCLAVALNYMNLYLAS